MGNITDLDDEAQCDWDYSSDAVSDDGSTSWETMSSDTGGNRLHEDEESSILSPDYTSHYYLPLPEVAREVLHFEEDGSRGAFEIETWCVETGPGSLELNAMGFFAELSIREVNEYDDEMMYPTKMVAEEEEEALCTYKGRVFKAQKGQHGEEPFVVNVRPRSARDRRTDCWRRLREGN